MRRLRGAVTAQRAFALDALLDGCWRAIEIASEDTADGSLGSHERTFDLLAGQGAWIGWAPLQPRRNAHLHVKRLTPDGMLLAIEIDSTHA